MHFTVSVESDLASQWSAEMDRLGEGIREAVQTAAREGVAEAKAVRTFKDRTGNLFASIRYQMDEVTQLGAVATISAGLEPRARYASFVENGTRPHRIEVRRRDALRWEDGDGVHFARSVNHPGTRAYPFMGPAYLKAERVLEREINAAIAHAGEIVGR